MFLEDQIPLLREIYSFDPTFHLLFQKWIIGIGAIVYQTDRRTLVIIPYGIYQKVEDELYCILKIKIKEEDISAHPTFIENQKFVYDGKHSLYMQFYFSETFWKERLKQYESLYKHAKTYLSRDSYLQLISMQNNNLR